MLKVDLSNVWGDLSLPDLLATEQEVFAAHKTLAEGRGPGNDFLGWLELPTFEETEELQRIVMRSAALLGIEIDPAGAREIASRSSSEYATRCCLPRLSLYSGGTAE